MSGTRSSRNSKLCTGQIASEIIHPDDIDIRFSGAFTWIIPDSHLTIACPDIGGLEPIIASLRESVIYPLQYPHLFTSSSLLGAPKGVLLFGPPGCGKTMLAKALAKESGATFINIAASVLTSKWFGDSNKLIAALFSLARKTQPSIVFIDEIDSFLRQRQKEDHEATGMMKAEFMTCVLIPDNYCKQLNAVFQVMGWSSVRFGPHSGPWRHKQAKRH